MELSSATVPWADAEKSAGRTCTRPSFLKISGKREREGGGGWVGGRGGECAREKERKREREREREIYTPF